MDVMELIIDFHKKAERQGPGSEEATKKALGYIPFELNEETKILDIGCGTGAQTMVLAEHTKAQITAIDLLQPFLDVLNEKIKQKNYENRIETQCLSMDRLPFQPKAFDVIWSEGAIYNIGFEHGLSLWKRYLKEQGYIVVSEISWLTPARPEEIEQYWLEAYPQINTIEYNLQVLKECGYKPITHFTLSDIEWIDHYYQPLRERSEAFLEKYNHAKEVKDFIQSGREEADMYDRFKDYYSYVFYIGKKMN